MADKRWKRVEREKCRALGGERSGPTGRDTPDCDYRVHVALEVKSYERFVWLTKDWEQAVANAAKVGKPPVLALKEAQRGGRDCVQMYLHDYNLLAGLAGSGGGDDLYLTWLPREAYHIARLPWSDFVRLYRAAYPTDQGEPIV